MKLLHYLLPTSSSFSPFDSPLSFNFLFCLLMLSFPLPFSSLVTFFYFLIYNFLSYYHILSLISNCRNLSSHICFTASIQYIVTTVFTTTVSLQWLSYISLFSISYTILTSFSYIFFLRISIP